MKKSAPIPNRRATAVDARFSGTHDELCPLRKKARPRILFCAAMFVAPSHSPPVSLLPAYAWSEGQIAADRNVTYREVGVDIPIGTGRL